MAEPSSRKHLVNNALSLLRFSGGKGLILTSDAAKPIEMRSPADAINLYGRGNHLSNIQLIRLTNLINMRSFYVMAGVCCSGSRWHAPRLRCPPRAHPQSCTEVGHPSTSTRHSTPLIDHRPFFFCAWLLARRDAAHVEGRAEDGQRGLAATLPRLAAARSGSAGRQATRYHQPSSI